MLLQSILEGWTIMDRLHLVRPPTLLINGTVDTARDFVVRPFFDNITKIKWITMDGGLHCAFWEEREKYIQIVNGFLAL